MAVDLIIILRTAQVLFSLITLGLNASVIHHFNTHQYPNGPPGYTIFLVFTSTWTLLISIPYTTFAPPYFPAYINRWASLAFELLTTVFWFAGWIAGAVWLGSLDTCGGLICHNAQAGVVFSALIWLCFCLMCYFPIKYCFLYGEHASGAGQWSLGMSGAKRITRARMRREKNNLVDVRAEREQEGGATGFVTKMKRAVRETMEVVKVRTGNVLAEWQTKAGRNESVVGNQEMRQHGHDQNTAAGSMGSRTYGYGARSVSPEGAHMV
ncbi:hypothetical protein PMZ80_009560 [Knufia obscura]|uniref:MARVEL domain-containing protein n=1 Tax=Knufia obscura TaxID=1635080 RepID=A0ABR0RBN7_9EURO|nr:hypothetical protein PMZ80_009560 [Knufia obscura]